jgi:ABC-type Fe3+-siderophore transport system permease subunit
MLLADVEYVQVTTQSGIGLGAAVAVVCSWQRNRSIILASIAGFFSWLYVIYFAITRRPDEYQNP